MTKNVLVISTTFRTGGNSDTLADEFIKGAESQGHYVEKISLREKQIGFCKGCLSCQKTGKCVIKDDAAAIVEKMRQSDVIVFATPIYYYEMSGQLKTLLDRANPLYPSDYKFRDIYFLASAADTDSHAFDYAAGGIRGWISCFPKAVLKETVFGAGVTDAGDIKGTPAAGQAYKAGCRI